MEWINLIKKILATAALLGAIGYMVVVYGDVPVEVVVAGLVTGLATILLVGKERLNRYFMHGGVLGSMASAGMALEMTFSAILSAQGLYDTGSMPNLFFAAVAAFLVNYAVFVGILNLYENWHFRAPLVAINGSIGIMIITIILMAGSTLWMVTRLAGPAATLEHVKRDLLPSVQMFANKAAEPLQKLDTLLVGLDGGADQWRKLEAAEVRGDISGTPGRKVFANSLGAVAGNLENVSATLQKLKSSQEAELKELIGRLNQAQVAITTNKIDAKSAQTELYNIVTGLQRLLNQDVGALVLPVVSSMGQTLAPVAAVQKYRPHVDALMVNANTLREQVTGVVSAYEKAAKTETPEISPISALKAVFVYWDSVRIQWALALTIDFTWILFLFVKWMNGAHVEYKDKKLSKAVPETVAASAVNVSEPAMSAEPETTTVQVEPEVVTAPAEPTKANDFDEEDYLAKVIATANEWQWPDENPIMAKGIGGNETLSKEDEEEYRLRLSMLEDIASWVQTNPMDYASFGLATQDAFNVVAMRAPTEHIKSLHEELMKALPVDQAAE